MNPEHTTHMATQTTNNPTIGKHSAEALPVIAQEPKAQIIHLGIDVHLRQHVVCRKIDAATPQPAQRFTPDEFIAWAIKQKLQAHRVVCCYEAGPMGYTLQRKLEAAGITCHVVRPQDWDRHGSKVKTDGRDARELVEHLARYEAGNKHALAVVRVPTPQQEQQRALSRQRGSFVNEVRRLGAMGRSHGMSQGYELSGRWWRKKSWAKWQAELPEWLKSLLEPLAQMLLQLEKFIAERTAQIEAQATAATQRPKGLGALTEQIISREVVDWGRFNNRRQVSSYTGLCPSEHSSGGSRRQGSINRHGNPHLRHALVEAVWRLLRMQPHWKRLEKLKDKQMAGQRVPVKKKMVVALARELAVDLWRLHTGRSTLEALGLQPATQVGPSAAATAEGQ
jgi:transposase